MSRTIETFLLLMTVKLNITILIMLDVRNNHNRIGVDNLLRVPQNVHITDTQLSSSQVKERIIAAVIAVVNST